jgi:hypothetical protein
MHSVLKQVCALGKCSVSSQPFTSTLNGELSPANPDAYVGRKRKVKDMGVSSLNSVRIA